MIGNVNREYPSLVLKDGQETNEQAAAAAATNEAQPLTAEYVNQIFDKRFAKITAKHENEKKAIQDALDAANARLAELEGSGDGKGKKDGEGEDDNTRKKYKDILTAEEQKRKNEELKRQAAERERDEARNEAARIRKQVAIQNAASKQSFFDLEDVMALTTNRVQFSDEYNQFVVLGTDGKPVENAKLEPMSLEEFYADFAAKRPYLVKSDAMQGAGSTENAKGGAQNSFGVVRTKADLKGAKMVSEYIDKFGEDAYVKLPLK